ncbi:hypothetical protein [Treponema sp. C6A8]|uniref:TP0183 family DNA metabolism protein n=1 Tax=Treponema sp. C6A8 TaxID=1410609 RepID=UPI00047FC88A|nr:hypothetical protein [Treponema sp. C6A8]
MQKELKKYKSFFTLLIFLSAFTFAQTYEIDYCGIFSSDLDMNMAKLTSDLYFTQLSETQNFEVTDRRSEFNTKEIEKLDKELFTPSKKTFFAEINKITDSDKWQTVFHLVYENSEVTRTKEYDSYYKILMEPKDNLKTSLSNLITKGGDAPAETKAKNDMPPAKANAISTEFLSGTWKAENGLNKVVIMRGGRGFVIFNNGASMNILINFEDAEGKKIKITQNQKSNASYFPELSREEALEHAINAQPIEWTLTASDSNTLKGAKHTLIKADGSVVYTDIPVTWTRIN